MMRVHNVQAGIVEFYSYDVSRYVEDKIEARQIRRAYGSIPGQLNHPNKRFRYTRLGKNLRFANLETAFDWLGQSGVALPVPRVGEPVFPLGLSVNRSARRGEIDFVLQDKRSHIAPCEIKSGSSGCVRFRRILGD